MMKTSTALPIFCLNLKTAPAIMGITMAEYCCYQMFQSCSNLIEAPVLHSETLAPNCYANMFEGCVNLMQIPALPALAMASYCYVGMFLQCTSLKISETQTEECPNAYIIPIEGTGTASGTTGPLTNMFRETSGTFTGTPSLNTIYYTNATII